MPHRGNPSSVELAGSRTTALVSSSRSFSSPLRQENGSSDQRFPLAVLYGIGTVVFPFFILQPSLGLGVAGSRTPKPMQARLKSLMTHTVFGAGLYLCALILSYLLRAGA